MSSSGGGGGGGAKRSKKRAQSDAELQQIQRTNDALTLRMERRLALCQPAAGAAETALRKVRAVIECLHEGEPSEAAFLAEEAVSRLNEVLRRLDDLVGLPEFREVRRERARVEFNSHAHRNWRR